MLTKVMFYHDAKQPMDSVFGSDGMSYIDAFPLLLRPSDRASRGKFIGGLSPPFTLKRRRIGQGMLVGKYGGMLYEWWPRGMGEESMAHCFNGQLLSLVSV